MKGYRLVAGAFLCAIWLGGCSSSKETREATPVPDAPASVVHTAYLITDDGFVAHRLADGTAEILEAGIRFGGGMWHAPGQRWTAVSVEKDGADYLSLVNPDGAYEIVHGPISDGDYSVIWAPTGDSLLVGHRSDEGGGISVYDVSSSTLLDVGCSASNQALSWGQGDWFVVGNGTNQYVVERSGCETLETIDARKLHEVTFGPRGERVAYILRELVYDREAREYRPDSSLYVADALGIDPVLVVGDRYRPHRPSWSLDATSLAFDARLPEDESRRLISIYDVDEKQSAFLNPDAVDSRISEWAPMWSPSGEAIAYMQSSRDAEPVVTIRAMTSSFTTIVGHPGEELAGWLNDNRLVLKGDSSTRIVGIDGNEILALSEPASILTVGVATAPVETGSSGSN